MAAKARRAGDGAALWLLARLMALESSVKSRLCCTPRRVERKARPAATYSDRRQGSAPRVTGRFFGMRQAFTRNVRGMKMDGTV
jgi:hypothetical protein